MTHRAPPAQRPGERLLHQVLGGPGVAGEHVPEPEQGRKRRVDELAEALLD